MSKIPVKFQVNNETKEILVDQWESLLEALRDNIGLTGTKEGCSNGNCGACTVQLEGKAIVSCCTLAVEVEGQHVTTVEGLATKDGLDPLQEAFMNTGVYNVDFAHQVFLCQPEHYLMRTLNPLKKK